MPNANAAGFSRDTIAECLSPAANRLPAECDWHTCTLQVERGRLVSHVSIDGHDLRIFRRPIFGQEAQVFTLNATHTLPNLVGRESIGCIEAFKLGCGYGSTQPTSLDTGAVAHRTAAELLPNYANRLSLR